MLLWSAGVNPLGAFIFTAFLKALPPPSLFPLGGKGKEEGGPLKRGEAEITQGVYPRCPIFPRKRLGVAWGSEGGKYMRSGVLLRFLRYFLL